jgi:hypothetical protein
MLVIVPNVGIHTQKSMLKINILYQCLETPVLSTLVSHSLFVNHKGLCPSSKINFLIRRSNYKAIFLPN